MNWFSNICFLYLCFIYGSFGGFYWVISRYVFGLFWQLLLFGHVWIRKDYIGISLVVFPCSFLVILLYHSGTSFMYVSLLTTISFYAYLNR